MAVGGGQGGQRRLGGAVVIEDEMVLQAKVEYIILALVLPIVEGVEQGEVVEQKAGMCQKVNGTVIRYDLGFQGHVSNIPGPLKQLALPVQQVKGWNDP